MLHNFLQRNGASLACYISWVPPCPHTAVPFSQQARCDFIRRECRDATASANNSRLLGR